MIILEQTKKPLVLVVHQAQMTPTILTIIKKERMMEIVIHPKQNDYEPRKLKIMFNKQFPKKMRKVLKN
jgi:hypothetical protein